MMSQDKLLYTLIAFISLIALFSFLASPVFDLHSLEFKGVKFLTVSDLKNQLRNYYHRNIWLIDKKEIQNTLAKNNYIKEVNLKKTLPDKLIINIRERTPLAKINNNGLFLTFTADGFILEKGPLKSTIQVPEITGFGYSFSNEKLVFSSSLEKIVQALAGIDSQTRSVILKIYKKKDKGVMVNLSQRFTVYLGDEEDLVKKFRVLESIIKKIEKEKLSIDYIDLRIIQKPVVKLKKV